MSKYMKAFVCEKYGPPQLLKIQEVPQPTPKENEVLLRIRATAINDYDWSMVRGKPYLYRLMFGIRKPKRQIPGMELAGTIEAIGSNVKKLKIGDAVYGDISDYGFGSFAEFICIHEKAVVEKPETMKFDEAASLPHAALLALQGLRKGNIKKGQRILINGGGGGVGFFGLQLAKLHECEVTGVDTGKKLETMKSLGFDYVIDYKKEDFTRSHQKYDLVLDCKTNRSPLAYVRSLKLEASYITVGGKPHRLLQMLCYKKFISLFHKKQLSILSLKPNQGLEEINQLYIQGKLKCVIDGPHTFKKIPELITYFGRGEHIGKIVVVL
ncbi:NAD(P)-dependent alcohol dehydrogenase [Kriegella aquimaris]|uniref:NADPH:quinone reductase n=1 Tax=Kriegella aquimaris TaxID=192904 RepID=A0A1G9TE61_9FLAO|nr:NAD(P)-dependent alcohol dehydrogenase [Kriegella aquimaris]SDM46021.1 NADPH:quinone reductase [Kriegella aquimaris]